MSRLWRIISDAALAVLATLCAVLLRADVVVQWPDLAASLPYLAVTAATSMLAVGASGLELGLWRFASLVDAVRVVGVALATTVATVAIVFAYNRLEGVARAIPVMQVFLVAFFLGMPRLLSRAHFLLRRRNPVPTAMPVRSEPAERVLVVGANSLAEVFLRALGEAGATHVKVAGIVTTRRSHVGRFLRQFPILGTVDEIDRIVSRLAVHGVYVGRLVLAVAPGSLSGHARDALTRLETEKGVRLDPLAARLAGSPLPGGAEAVRTPGTIASVTGHRPTDEAAEAAATAFRPEDLERLARTPYWRWKRTVDIVATGLAALLLLPVLGLAFLLVTIDLGWPPIFWQDRLGLGGASFRLYKFRTMSPAHDRGGAAVPDDDRLSLIGRLMRRSRLDELPQLWNVLSGDMSLIGPRPLLPVDQPAGPLDRLLVRPGLTGWAQVHGGRRIGPVEKAALDVWWIRHATFAIDLRIVIGTVRTTVFGETVSATAASRAVAVARDE